MVKPSLWSPAAYVAVLCIVHLVLTFVALGVLPFPYRVEFMVGIGDSQIALAMVLLTWSTTRWSLRLPFALILFLSGWACHYVTLVDKTYPFVFGEEYFVSLAVAAGQFAALTLIWRYQRVALSSQTGGAANWPGTRFTVHDMLVWVLTAGISLAVIQRSIALTDVSGMYDPWETFSFGMIEAPSWFFPRLPLLFAALLLHAIAWTAIAWMMLSPMRLSWQRGVSVLTAFLVLTIGEILVSSGVLIFDKPWPLLPVSCLWGLRFVNNLWLVFGEGRQEFSLLGPASGMAVVLVTRLGTFSLSMLLLRFAGFRVGRLSDLASQG